MRQRPLLLIVTAWLALTGCDALAQSGTLRVRLNADIRSTEPGVNRDANTDAVIEHVVEGLVAMREDSTVGPLLAQSVQSTPDGRTYTFKLRDAVSFQNGAPLTAADVVWTWKRYLAPATQWRCLPEFDGRGQARIMDVQAADARTVVFTLDRPSAMFLIQMARPDCGGAGIYHRSSVAADGRWVAPVGTGPFMLGEWKRGQYVELRRFPNYASRREPMDGNTGAKKAEVESLRFMVIPDSAASKTALLAGAVDIVPDINVGELGDLNGRPLVRIEKVTIASLNCILLQTRDPLMRDLRMRRALALAIDAREVVRGTTNGLARPNPSAVPEGSPFHTALHDVGYAPDLPHARRLLAEAGYQGQAIKLITNKRYPSMFDAALLVQASAARAGIRIELEVLDWASQFDRYSRGDYQAMSFSYSARPDPSLAYDMFVGPKDTQPRKVWDDAQARSLLAESMQAPEKGRRQALLDALHRRMLDEVPILALYNGVQINAVSTRVVGFRGWQAELPRLWNVRLQ